MIFLIWVVTLAPLPWPVTPVMGATFNVNTTADTTDANPGDGTCADSSGNCSLRAAIQEANAQAGADTIILQPNTTYTLSLDTMAVNEDSAAEDDLDIVAGSTITIQGNGATIRRDPALGCTLDGTVVVGEFRIFEVLSGGNLTLQNVTVTNGCADGSFPDSYGGGILNRGTVTLTNSTISGNRAGDSGGGIYNSSMATITLTNSTISGNRAGDSGGGIANDFGSTATITNSTISNNSAGGFGGGGIFNGFNSTATITNSTISNNSAVRGGGIANDLGTVTLTNSTVSGNSASSEGGGIFNNNTVNASFVTIANNTGSSTGAGGIFNFGGGVNIKNSIVGNNAGGPNCSGTLNATGTNLATDNTCTGFTQVPSTGAGGLNLGPLQVNAPGTTATHALQSGSAAIDAVTDCTDLRSPPQPVTTDQRGVARPQGALCDVGAFELEQAATGSIKIIKDAVPNDPQDFSFSGSLGAFSLDDDNDATLPNQRTFSSLTAGSYTVTENLVSGWKLTGLVCTDPDGGTTVNLNTRTATIDLDAGETVTCTFTNTRLEVSLFVLQGNGHCLQVDRNRGTYRFRAADGRVFTGSVRFTQRGSRLTFLTPRGQIPMLGGTIDLSRRTGSAALVIPPRGGQFVITDQNIDDNSLCPP